MAIGSAPEPGRQFRTGTNNIYYEWVVDGELLPLMTGEAVIVYVPNRPDNHLPDHSRWEWARIKTTPANQPERDTER